MDENKEILSSDRSCEDDLASESCGASELDVNGEGKTADTEPLSITPEAIPKNKRDNAVKRLITLAVCVSLALILSFIESRIPTFVAIPGVKLGLANIAVVFCLYRLGIKDAIIVSVVRVCLSSLLFGSITSFLYGLSGAVLSMIVMLIIKKIGLSPILVSTLGGISHNIAQICVASIILDTNVVGYYLPFLVLSGCIAGIVIGIAGGILVLKVPKNIS